MKNVLILFVLMGSNLTLLAQSKKEQFFSLVKAKDSTKAKLLLVNWEKSNPDDPDFYICAFNYYFQSSMKEVVSIDQIQSGNMSFAINKENEKRAGFINQKTIYEESSFRKALSYIDKGIELHPNRLDMRFGKCAVLARNLKWKEHSEEVIKAIKLSKINYNKWLWTDGVDLKDPEKFLLSSIQSYMKDIYDTEDDNLLPYIVKIGEATINVYPNNIEILTFTATALTLMNEFAPALGYLKKAAALDPKDLIVLNNLGMTYIRMKDAASATRVFEQLLKIGDNESKEKAKYFLAELKKIN